MAQIRVFISAVVLCLLVVPGGDCSDVKAALVPGVWELVELSPVSMMDSNPRGFSNHREYYRGDGHLCFLDPSETSPDVEKCVAVRFEGNNRIVTGPDGSESSSRVVEVTEGLATIQFPDGSRFQFRKLDEHNGLLPIKPQSLHVLEVREGPQAPAREVKYLDTSGIEGNRKLVGVWEVIEFRDVPQHDRPPYGFPNYKWVFEDKRWAQVSPTSEEVSEDGWSGYSFDGNVLRFEDGEKEVDVSFSQWGDLVLKAQFGQMTLRQLTTDPTKIPVLPFKVCVLSDSERLTW